MTAEQLEEMLDCIEHSPSDYWTMSTDDASHLARRVISAEKLVEALGTVPLGDGHLAQLVTAYREASK